MSTPVYSSQLFTTDHTAFRIVAITLTSVMVFIMMIVVTVMARRISNMSATKTFLAMLVVLGAVVMTTITFSFNMQYKYALATIVLPRCIFTCCHCRRMVRCQRWTRPSDDGYRLVSKYVSACLASGITCKKRSRCCGYAIGAVRTILRYCTCRPRLRRMELFEHHRQGLLNFRQQHKNKKTFENHIIKKRIISKVLYLLFFNQSHSSVTTMSGSIV